MALDKEATGVVYRFEFYKYTGAHDPETYEAKAKTSDTPQQPDPADLGPFIVAQMAGINFDGQVPPLPAPPAAPAINASIPDAVLNISYSAKIDASASDPADILTYSVTGLPAGLSVDGSTGIISGQVGDPGLVGQVFTLNINVADVTNGFNTSIATPFSVVDGQVTLAAGDQIGTVGQAFAYHLSATGGTGVFEYSLIGGPLPDGLALDALTGIISGTPTTVGTSALTLLAIDSLGYGSDSVPLTITINDAAPVVPDVVACSGTNEVITNAVNVRAAIVETRGGPNNGGPAIQIAKATTTIVPPLDVNTFFAGGNLITYSGTLSQGVCVSDTTSISQGLTLANVPAQTVNFATTITPVPVVISGGVAPYTISVGNLPLGFSLAGTDIVGASIWVGTTPVTLSVSDSNGQSTYQTFDFTVNPPAGIVLGATNVPTTGQVGTAFNGSVSATGGYGSLNWTGAGLPTGVSISAAGILSGTPSVAGAFTPVLKVTDGAGQVATVNASVVIAAAPVVNPPPAASCTVPKGAIKSAAKSVITAVNGTTLSTQAGTTLSILPCAAIQWNRTSHVYRVGDRIEWKGWKDGAVVDVYNATLN
ncbi:Ig domain-containing protein [uncultured Thiodictyon sp.]|uniref:Ig domain-containing protein n=1 Tax=uncultured Thiodictyon sp. TaxID=1846217 RepID=UPI0025E512B4|nr:Ig domain-containing protein [uncultured Thiodictyon sp.]